MRTFDAPVEKILLKTKWGKDKMLVTNVFSFSSYVFYPLEDKFNVSASAFHLDKAKFCHLVRGLTIKRGTFSGRVDNLRNVLDRVLLSYLLRYCMAKTTSHVISSVLGAFCVDDDINSFYAFEILLIEIIKSISECNTVLCAYTKFRHLE